jgi:hypothetical protein
MRELSTDFVYGWYHMIILPNLASHCGVGVKVTLINKGEQSVCIALFKGIREVSLLISKFRTGLERVEDTSA